MMRNFGWRFATLNVTLAESSQRTTQWNYGSSLNDFIQRIGNDYWGVVQAQENLRVAESALKFNNDLVRVNRISVQVGTLAPIDLQEAQSAAATAEANVYAAEAVLKTARAQLRQDVMLNPAGTFVPEDVEPAEAVYRYIPASIRNYPGAGAVANRLRRGQALQDRDRAAAFGQRRGRGQDGARRHSDGGRPDQQSGWHQWPADRASRVHGQQ